MMDELSRWYENMTYQEAKDILREKLDNMKSNFIAAGYYMKYIRDHEQFREDGYESIWEFAEDNYGIKKSTASRWMAMNDKFSQGGNSPILAEEYRGFEKSQLQEMLYLDDKQMETVTPEMTVKEIREVRKPEELSAYGTKRRVYPEDSLLKTKGCEGGHDCFSCAQECAIRGENRYCRETPIGNPAPCYTVGGISFLRENVGEKCQFVNHALAKHDARGDAVPCCKECKDPCKYQCKEYLKKLETETVATSQQQEDTDTKEQRYSSCPPGQQDCRRQEWGSSEEQQAAGKKECAKCWDDYEKRTFKHAEPVATSQQKELDPEPDMNPPEEEAESEPEVIAEENIEVVDADEESPEELYEEVSEESDIELLREELDKAKKNLDLMLSCYTGNDIRVRKQKLIVGALEGTICDLDADDIPKPEQPELPALKNNSQRKEFLNKYQAWPVWFEVPEASEIYHRFDLPDGSSIVICEYHMWLDWKEKWGDESPDSTGTREYLLKPGYHYLQDCRSNMTDLVEHLKNVRKGAK